MSSDIQVGPASSEPGVPAAAVERKRGLSMVWVVPIVAAGIGGWLWWDAIQKRGPEIKISFSTADGLEAGKTKIRFKDVEIGEVGAVDIKPDLSGVLVTAEMKPSAEPMLHEASRFWVVRPRIGIGGVSGLGTLLSGAYLEIDPVLDGKSARDFVGLEVPPQTPTDAPGLKLKLMADTLGSVSIGSPVAYDGLVVGKVEAYHLVEGAEHLEIEVYIDPEYAARVHEGSRFWNASGIDISFGAEGIKFTATSLVSLMTGGIEFDTPTEESATPLARSGASYHLYADHTASREVFKSTREAVLYFNGSLRGLAVGAPVEFRGIRLGTVESFGLVGEPLEKAISRVVVQIEPERIGRGFAAGETIKMRMASLITAGVRARLSTSSLLTGALFVDVVLDPDAPAVLRGSADEFELPTVESTAEALAATADEIPALMADARRAVASLARLAASSDVQNVVGDFRDVGTAASAALERANAIFASIEKLLADQSNLQIRISTAIDEVAAGMRSIRQLADTLERQPESLIKGKSSSSGDR